jgi:DNA recombination protein RmuC
MQAAIIVLLIVILCAVVGGVALIVRSASAPKEVVPPPAVDLGPIVEAVKAAIDVGAISTGVQGAVESKIHEAATKVLSDANESARKLAEERLGNQASSLELQTQNLLKPFETQMAKLNEEVDKLRTANSEKFGDVDSAVKGLALQTQALKNVLSSAQGRGNWGERMLEDILSESGFIRGINYEKQETLVEGGRPDYSFFLPPDRVLYLDSKFPLDNYLEYFNAVDDNSRNDYKNKFIKNVEDRVKELEKRDYVAQSTRSALDYVLLFIPNEGVISFIQQHKPSLIDESVAKRVILCSPLTLYTFLGVVRQATDSFHMEQNANEVLLLLKNFGTAWKSYTKYLKEIQRHFDQMQKKLKAVTTGRVASNLRKPLDRVEELTKERGIAGSDEDLKAITAAFEAVDDESDEDSDDE